MGLNKATYEAELAKGIRCGTDPSEDAKLSTLPAALALALGVTEDKVASALGASPALYAHAVQLGRLRWSSPAARAAGLHDLGLGLANTSTITDATLMTSIARNFAKAIVPSALRTVESLDPAKAAAVEANATTISASAVPSKSQMVAASANVAAVLSDVVAANAVNPAIPAVASALATSNVAGFALAEADPVRQAVICAFVAEQASLASKSDTPLTTAATNALAAAVAATPAVGGAAVKGT